MPSLGQAEDRFIIVNNVKLHYLDWGNEAMPPVLLLSGTRGCAHDWDYLASYLQVQYHCLALDQRGQGDSQWTDTYKAQDFATDIALFIDALNLDKVSVLGLSLGGKNAIFYVASHPEKVAKLILVDIGPEVDPRGVKTLSRPKYEFSSLAEFVDSLRQREPLAQEEVLYHYATFVTKKLPDGRLTWKHDPQMNEAVTKVLESGVEVDVMWQLLAQIKCSTLIVRGAESNILSHEVAQRMVAVMPQAKLVEIQGAGHAIIWSKPDQFYRVVERFLRQERRDYG